MEFFFLHIITVIRYNIYEVIFMLKTLCNLKEISVYRCSKDTNIPYSTLSDIANHKTD